MSPSFHGKHRSPLRNYSSCCHRRINYRSLTLSTKSVRACCTLPCLFARNYYPFKGRGNNQRFVIYILCENKGGSNCRLLIACSFCTGVCTHTGCAAFAYFCKLYCHHAQEATLPSLEVDRNSLSNSIWILIGNSNLLLERVVYCRA